VLIITDTSIKNNVAILISHIHRGQEIITKSVYHATNVNSTEAELFTIKYEINHTTHIHPYQLHSIAILKDLKEFLNKSLNNFINFWDCPDSIK